jgi:hypothetical protein
LHGLLLHSEVRATFKVDTRGDNDPLLIQAKWTIIVKCHTMWKSMSYNFSNFKQKNAIIDAENPFGNNFDATRIWGPIMGINVYAGVRYSLKRGKPQTQN